MNPGDFRFTHPGAVDVWRRILARACGRPVPGATLPLAEQLAANGVLR